MSALLDIGDVIERHTGHARRVLEYTQEMKRTVDRAKAPGFDATGWEPLGRMVATADFRRVGPFKDEMSWPEYVTFLTGWATASHWECSFRRITEAGNLVFLELEERMVPGDSANAVNSLSAFELDDAGLLRRLDVYLQLPGGTGGGG